MKNIPIPPKTAYLKKLIEKVENVIKRMRWKAFFFEQDGEQDGENHEEQGIDQDENNNYGFKSRKCLPQIEDMEKFEDELSDMVRNIKFRRVRDDFQDKLKDDIKQINNSSKALISADKTTNLYELDKTQYDKSLHQTVTKTYKKAKKNISNIINEEAKDLATELDIENRMECMAKQQAFISLKDHKENFQNNPTCRLINPAKSEMGLVSKKILEKINAKIGSLTSLNQWKTLHPRTGHQHNYAFKKISSFPSRHCLSEKGDSGLFDVTMGSYDGAEVS